MSLDSDHERDVAAADSRTFLNAWGKPLIIDEIQRVGETLVLAVKVEVDNDNTRGQFILTGSTNFLTVPTISESLAGRVGIVTLWPFSQGELTGGTDGFVDRAFDAPDDLAKHRGVCPRRADYFEALCVGGFPAVQGMSARMRRQWFESYVDTVLRREVELVDDIRRFGARDRTGAEVDVVLEAPDGRVVGIEIKATSTPRMDDFRWLKFLRDRLDRARGRVRRRGGAAHG